MKKRLITVKNLSEFVQNKELVVQADMIITPGAKDIIREQGVEVRYEKSFCESNCESENKEMWIEYDPEVRILPGDILIKQL